MTQKAFDKRWAEFADKTFGGFNSMPQPEEIRQLLLDIRLHIDDFLISYETNGESWKSGGDTIFIKFKSKISPLVFRAVQSMCVDEFDPMDSHHAEYVASLADVFPKDCTNWYRLWWD